MPIHDTIVNVPLWHEELLYEINNVEYLIKMVPDLEKNVCIIDNNLVFNVSYRICDIWETKMFTCMTHCILIVNCYL